MKKVLLIIILLIILVCIIFGIIFLNFKKQKNINNNLNQSAMQEEIYNNINENETQNSQDKGEIIMQNLIIKLTINENEIFVNLDNNIASREFLEILPLTLTFEDFNNTEKIASLPTQLSTEGLPSGYTPNAGDFAYYAPWGNISVFYNNFRYSDSLYKLGTIESGIELLENIHDDFEVTIERVN